MGLDATVMCTCWARGLLSPSPFSAPIVLDDEGYLGLDLPWEGHEDEHMAFLEWSATACMHVDMDAACERISNWGGYRLFQDALAQVGWERVPTLKAVLPEMNGGSVSSEQSRACLAELDLFTSAYRGVPAWTLMDDERAQPLFEYIRAYEGVFIMSGSTGLEVGVDDRGLFIRRAATSREIFRAKRVAQRRLAVRGRDGAELIDLDTRRRLVIPLHVEVDGICPSLMSVQLRPRDATYFDYAVRPLRVVFQASVETGNPVRWC